MTAQLALFADGTEAGAVFSPDRVYRYRLWRAWGSGPRVNFLMLNPSTADEEAPDPTVTRCINYARAWDFDGLVVTNLFAFKSTDPKGLLSTPAPIGPENDRVIVETAKDAGLVVAAWGNNAPSGRVGHVLRLLGEHGVKLHCLKRTGLGNPGHPLYLPARLTPQPMEVSS